MSKIYPAILGVMAECGAIAKDTKNAKQGFYYRGVDAVMNALQPLMKKHGIFVVPEVISQHREERKGSGGGNLIYSILTVKYNFFAEDGSAISAVVIGEGMDSGDKASNKAMSVAFKYACFQVFCIPTEEMKDPDADTPPPSEPTPPRRVEGAKKPDPIPDADLPFDEPVSCEECGCLLIPMESANGRVISADILAAKSREKYGKVLCVSCVKKHA